MLNEQRIINVWLAARNKVIGLLLGIVFIFLAIPISLLLATTLYIKFVVSVLDEIINCWRE